MQSRTGAEISRQEFYVDARSQIKNGDVLMYRGRSLQSRLICLLTHSRYSHAGLAVWWNDRLVVMEAVGRGVMVSPLSSNVRHYDGRVEWFASREEIPESDRLQLVAFAQRELGKEYARWRAILLGLRILFNRRVEERDKLRRERKLFCSYYVAQAYNAINRDLKKGVSDRFMSPGDIATSPLLRRVAILRRKPAVTEKESGREVSRSAGSGTGISV